MRGCALLWRGCAAVLAVLSVSAAAFADPTTEALLRRVEAATRSAKTITADLTKISMDGTTDQAAIRLMKPNYAVIRYKSPGQKSAPIYIASNGKSLWRFPDAAKNNYQTAAADPLGKGLVSWLDGLPVQTFFGLGTALNGSGMDATNLKYDGAKVWEGDEYQILRHDMEEDGKRYTAWLYVGKDSLIHRHVGTFYILGKDGKPLLFEVALRNIKQNAALKTADFAYTPSPEATPIVEVPLLAAGAVAPGLLIQDREGRPLPVSGYKGKVVILDFWASWCLPCVRGMAHTNSVARKFKNDGVVALAINVMDSKAAFVDWVKRHPEYSSLRFVIDSPPEGKASGASLYNVTNIPVQYVIGRDGKVFKSFLGFSGPTPELEEAVRAALAQPGSERIGQ